MKKIIIIMLIATLAAVALTACAQRADENSYTVTFIDSSLGVVSYAKGQNVPVPAEPKREGYIFRGWFADAECTVPFDFEAVRNENVSVYAKWIPAFFTVTFEDADLAPVRCNSGEKVPIPDVPIKDNYVFAGWYADEARTTEFDFNVKRYENVTLYAKWEKLPAYEFTFTSLTDYFGSNPIALYDGYLTDSQGNWLDGYAVTAITIREITDIVIPENYNGKPVYVIGSSLFQGKDIENVTVPASVVFIDGSAFKNCKKLKNVVFSPVTDPTIVYGSKIMDAIAAAQIPVNPQVITNPVTFANMEIVNEVYLTCSRLSIISSQVFYGCSSIEELRLPPMLVLMGMESFYECKALKDVYVEHRIDWNTQDGPSPSWMGTHGFENMFSGCIRLENIYVHLYNGYASVYTNPEMLNGVEVYKQHMYWSAYAVYIKANPDGN
jgi:uncharacterized repeat protein (TIGR02543 family)